MSEFSYGYGVIEEITTQVGGRSGMRAAPLLPSLLDEYTLGFDANLELVHAGLFLQFKRSDKLVRNSAGQAWHFGVPYFRFPLTYSEISDQHNLLCYLQQSLAHSNDYVFYVAPSFYSSAELDEHYEAGTICDNSLFLPPGAVGSITGPHVVAFSQPNDARCFSEPTFLEVSNWSSWLERILASEVGVPLTLDEYLERTVPTIEEVAQPTSDRSQRSMMQRLVSAAALAGCQVLLIGSGSTA
jgi:hypothetical protein